MINPAYVGVIALGLLHGIEPGHGWPMAVMYSTKRRAPFFSAFLSSSILGIGHLISSIAIVVAYVLLQKWLNFEAPWLRYVAAGILLVVAMTMLFQKVDVVKNQHGHTHEDQLEIEHEHEHEHPAQGKHIHWHTHTAGATLSIWGLTSYAFILGFAHEEEFALLALVASGISAWTLMISYGVAVLLSLIAITVICVKIYKVLQSKIAPYEKYIPKISAMILIILAIVVVFW